MIKNQNLKTALIVSCIVFSGTDISTTNGR